MLTLPKKKQCQKIRENGKTDFCFYDVQLFFGLLGFLGFFFVLMSLNIRMESKHLFLSFDAD